MHRERRKEKRGWKERQNGMEREKRHRDRQTE